MQLRKYRGKLMIMPSKRGVKSLLSDLKECIKRNRTLKAEELIHRLNLKIRGWVNYYRHVCSKKTFSDVDHAIFKMLWKWSKRRHTSKPQRWIKHKYFKSEGMRDWIFTAEVSNRQGKVTEVELVKASHAHIKRHIKIRSETNIYDPIYASYINDRKRYLKRRKVNWKMFKEKSRKAGLLNMAL